MKRSAVKSTYSLLETILLPSSILLSIQRVKKWVVIIALEMGCGFSVLLLSHMQLFFALAGMLFFLLCFFSPLIGLLITIGLDPFWGISVASFGRGDIRAQDPSAIIAFCGWLAGMFLRDRWTFAKVALNPQFLFLVGWITLSLFWSQNPKTGLYFYVQILYGILLFFLAVNLITDEATLKRVITLWVLFGLVASILGVFEFLMLGTKKLALLHSQGAIGEQWTGAGGEGLRTNLYALTANRLGLFLNFCFVLLIYKIFASETVKYRFLLVLGFSIMLFTLITTFSRSSWLAFTTICLLYTLNFRSGKWLIIFLPLVLGAGLLLLWNVTLTQALYYRFSTLFHSPEEVIFGRVRSWSTAIHAFLSSPLFGMGVGGARVLIPQIDLQAGRSGHMLFLNVLVEYGLIGAVFFLSVVVKVVQQVVLINRSSLPRADKTLINGLAIGLIAYLVQGVTTAFSLKERLMWIFLGLTVAALNIYKSKIATLAVLDEQETFKT